MSIEELVNSFPGAVRFFIERRLPCLVCGEAVWGTIEEIALEQGFTNEQIDQLVHEMNNAFNLRANG